MVGNYKIKNKKSQQLKETIELAVKDLTNNQEKPAVIQLKPAVKNTDELAENQQELDLDLARRAVLEEIKPAEVSKKEKIKERKKIKFKVAELTTKLVQKEKDLTINHLQPVASLRRLSLFFPFKAIFLTFVFLLFFCFIVFTSGLYLGRWQGPLMVKFTHLIPLPIVYINGEAIRAHTFLSDLAVLQNYLKRQNQPIETQAMRRQVLERLIQLKVAAQLAEKEGIKVSDDDIKSRLSDLWGDADLFQETQKLTQELYGWDFPMYVEKVIRPIILTDKLKNNFYATDINAYLQERMKEILNLFNNEPSQFTKIASEVNEDDSRLTNGDLGWLKLGETAPEFELQLLKLEPGEVSPIIETRYGYHIIKLEEKIVDKEDQPIFHVSHIFLKRPLFEYYLNEQIKKAMIVTLIRI